MPSTHLMKICDYIVKSYSVGITFPFLSMEMVCVRRPEIKKEYSQEWNLRGMCIYKYTN